MGIIDSLSAGFRLILRRWWLMLIPVLLDLLLWIGPRISVAGLILGVKGLLVLPTGVELSSEYQTALTQIAIFFDGLAERANLVQLLSLGIPGIPTLLSALTPPEVLAGARQVIEVDGAGAGLQLALATLIIGALFASLYVTWIGRFVLIERQDVGRIVLHEHTWRNWLRVLLLLVLLLGLLLVVGLPVLMLSGFVMMISPAAGIVVLNLLTILLLWIGIWLAVYLYFVIQALVINRVGLFKAMWNSLNVVARNFWSTVGLILLINVISAGMLQIWQRLAFASWSTLLAILANAFISTGLVAGTLIFYHARYTRWQENPGTLNLAIFTRKSP